MVSDPYKMYVLVRELVRDQSWSAGDIAKRTGYSVAYVRELRRRAPQEDERRLRIFLSRWSVEMLSVLRRAKDAVEALDGTTAENEKLVDDYRKLIAEIGNRA